MADSPTISEKPEPTRRRPSVVRRVFMRPRKVVVKTHRWLSIVLVVWLVVISLTGGWLVEHHAIDSWLHHDRYASASGDVGPEAAKVAVEKKLAKGATVYGVTMPSNGRGVYQVGVEVPGPTEESEATYLTYLVNPGTGAVNGQFNSEEGFSWWMYRGHMYLWQDNGLFNAFNAQNGWCKADAKGHEPGGAKGLVCDVVPAGDDMVAWFAVAWIVVLLTGFYLWYWPGVKRWATAFAIRRGRGSFALNMSIHKVVGLVVWVPLVMVAFTGAAFAFPNMKSWYENATPANRGMELWDAPEKALASGEAAGRKPVGLDRFVDVLETTYPARKVDLLNTPSDGKATYTAWMSRGYDPWSREGGAGNVYMSVDQYSGKVLYDGKPSDANSFDQAWDDWSFPLHTGDFGGPITRVIWVFIALSPLVMAITGVSMTLIRRSKRKRRATRRIAPTGTTAEPSSNEGESVLVGAGQSN